MRWNLLILGVSVVLMAVLIAGPDGSPPEISSSKEGARKPVQPPSTAPGTSDRDRTKSQVEAGRTGPGGALVYRDPLFSPPPSRLGAEILMGIDYSDPTAAGVVPLIMVEGLENEFLSRHFRVADLMARDGAPYARISPTLVNSLEHIMWLAEAPLYVSSGYRHPSHNANPSVGGVARSQHLAGLAADVWSNEKSPSELAELALDVTECDIGIGLGRNFIHLDLRGYLASWTEDDAAMDEASFDAWVRARCAALDESSSQPLPSFAEALKAATERAKRAEAEAEDALIATYRDVMTAFAEGQLRTQGSGAVMLDLRQDSLMQQAGIPYKLSYALPESEEVQTWKLDALIQSVQTTGSFAFAIIKPDGALIMGAMGYAAVRSEDG